MFHSKQFFLALIFLIGFVGVQSWDVCSAQDETDLEKKEAAIQEQMAQQALQKLQQENPQGLTDEELKQGQEDLEASEQNLEENFNVEAAQAQDAADDTVGVGDEVTTTTVPVVRPDLHEEETRRIEEEGPTRNSAFE